MTRVMFVLLCCMALLPAIGEAAPLTIFAAASLKPALDDLAAHGALGATAPRLVYGASSSLARQIEQDAPADLFVSADEDWMDELATRGDIVAATRHDLLGNALVLVAPATSDVKVDLREADSFRKALGMVGRLSIALPDSVPAGRYASESLHALGLWDSVAGKLAMSRDVRAALQLVAKGECPLGIVYRSDAVSEPRVRVVATFPADSHKPIVYPAALVHGHDGDAARALLHALQSPRAQAVFRRYGFDAPPASPRPQHE
ncbi:MAG: molybdate ABC transporter substrate-binding protein [Proteobacteria bacterium]|nr:molybdate ABC transporter substrate-binding protein [Pseudomonadota bacterium]